jgi:hypothetical protein
MKTLKIAHNLFYPIFYENCSYERKKQQQKLVHMPNEECIKGKFVNLCLSRFSVCDFCEYF